MSGEGEGERKSAKILDGMSKIYILHDFVADPALGKERGFTRDGRTGNGGRGW